MCGICGFVDFKRCFSQDVRNDIVHKMNNQMIYRGPDKEGIYNGNWLTLGMRRLSIIDLNTGSQPIYSSSKSAVLIFNGEIYNYLELKLELENKGYKFITQSDTEVIANLFEEYGTKSFKMLDGMFAIALYDISNDVLYLIRDRMGEKPLYYYADNEKMIFGSELKCLQNTAFLSNKINIAALNFFFQYTYIPAPFSIYEDVHKLIPGHYLAIYNDGNLQDECYWKLEKNIDYYSLSYEEAKRELFQRLDCSVKKRIRSDVPIGAFLSGGFDSGTIVALMAQNTSKPVNTFTIGLNTAADESNRALRMAKHIGSNHTNFILDYKDSISVVSDIVSHMDEPFADSSCIPEYLVSKLAANHVKVVLTGDAGDELFLGYSKYLINYYSEKYLRVPSFIRKKIFEPTLSILPDKSYLSLKVGKVIRSAYENEYDRGNIMMQLGFKDDECISLFKKEFFDLSGQNIISSYYDEAIGDNFEKVQYTDLHVVLEGDMLTKVDRMSMLNSLETRTPLLSNDLVEFAYSLPSEYKLYGKTTKRIMKDTFKHLFPKGYDKLPKSGFGVPIDEWFRKEMKEEILDLMSENRIKTQQIFNYEYIKKILDEHISGKVNRKSEIWALYIFENWYEKNSKNFY